MNRFRYFYLLQFMGVILITMFGASCFKTKKDAKPTDYVLIKNTLSVDENTALIEPFLDGAWVSVSYLQSMHEKGLPSLVKNDLSNISCIIIPQNLQKHPIKVPVGGNFNQSDTAQLSFRKSGHAFFPTLKTKEEGIYWNIHYKLTPTDTFLGMNKYTENGDFIETTRFFRMRTLLPGDLVTIPNVQMAINRLFFSGKYSPKSNCCGFVTNFEFKADGSVKGHKYYTHFSLIPDIHNGTDYLILWNKTTVDKYQINSTGQTISLHNENSGENIVLSRQYDVFRNSEMWNEKVIDLSIDDTPENITIHFSVNTNSGIDPQTDSLYRRIINSGYFNYKIFYENGLLVSDYQFNRLFLGDYYTQHGFLYFTELGKKRIAAEHNTKIVLPKILLRNVPAGRRKFKLFIYQQEFNRAIVETRRANIGKVLINKSLPFIWAEIHFESDIPPIYVQQLKTLAIESEKPLAVDFSVSGKKATADLFWQIQYPQFGGIYYRAPLLRNTLAYTKPNEIRIYYTNTEQSMSVQLFDYDGKNKSQLISKWDGKIKDLGGQSDDVWKTLRMPNGVKMTYSISPPQLVNKNDSLVL